MMEIGESETLKTPPISSPKRLLALSWLPPTLSIPKYRLLLVVQSPLFYNHGKFQ